MKTGDLITLDIEKPTAGGRMLARLDGQVVFVWGAIPGERVRARVSRVAKGVGYAETVEVVQASSDRRQPACDWRCGGSVFVHVRPERQVQLKAEIISDGFRRLAKLPLETPPPVRPSPEHGYRMRARLHVAGHRIGFLRESSHELCEAGPTGQLLVETAQWIDAASEALQRHGLDGVQGIELSESIDGGQRACHLDLRAGARPGRFSVLPEGLTGLSAGVAGATPDVLRGTTVVDDTLTVTRGASTASVRLRRHVQAFFQGNRFLLGALADHVASHVPPGPVVDLYAGVGLFGLALAALGHEQVTLVEGDRFSSESLVDNAVPFGPGVQVRRMSVEEHLRTATGRGAGATLVADPPRTGLSREAVEGIVDLRPSRIVYVSCDVATLARDTRLLLDAGYRIIDLTAFDLFPNTAHVECVAVFDLA